MTKSNPLLTFGVPLLSLILGFLLFSPKSPLQSSVNTPLEVFKQPSTDCESRLEKYLKDQTGLPEKGKMAFSQYSLPQLPYAYDALEPHISKQIMELHHSKHHQTYVTNLNAAIGTLSKSSVDVPLQISLQAAVKFNGGGHINHSLFWKNLAPASSPEAKLSAAPKLIAAIKETWGDKAAFQAKFKEALLGIQGSGWGWLVKVEAKATGRKKDQLVIVTTKDQDPVVGKGEVPVFGVDMWEHAYYLQYLNGKAAYVDNIWNIINWKTAEERFIGSGEDTFAALKAAL